ncbi:MAG: response regulator transcription factor [Chitinophagaceae bacterium]|nr:MAG: response regulator transcription factor [Chitinophagaceae bacterium]
MPRIKIVIVEDEMVIARTIESTLDELGYTCCGPASSYGEALELLETEKPDLVLLDINLAGKKDGIDLAEKINVLYQIPFIFLTANSDMATIERAKKVKPHAYIVKPFNKEELFAAIEIAFSNYTAQRNASDATSVLTPVTGSTFLKDGKHFHRVAYADIVYIESDNNYTAVFLVNARKLLIRSSFTEFLGTLPISMFVRIHRSYAVNTSRIDSIDTDDVTVGGVQVPLSRSYRENVMKVLGISE